MYRFGKLMRRRYRMEEPGIWEEEKDAWTILSGYELQKETMGRWRWCGFGQRKPLQFDVGRKWFTKKTKPYEIMQHAEHRNRS